MALFGLNQGQFFGADHVWQLWAIAIVLIVALYYPTKYFRITNGKARASLPSIYNFRFKNKSRLE